MTENKNPFLKPYNTPHDTAPFHLIKICLLYTSDAADD